MDVPTRTVHDGARATRCAVHAVAVLVCVLGGCTFARPEIAPGPRCGDGVVDEGERCDGDCPTACDDGDPCTRDALEAPGTCLARCTSPPILETAPGDGCCPLRADRWVDDDCAPICGDGIVDDEEICDTGALAAGGVNSCPACDDGDACTIESFDDRWEICRPESCVRTAVVEALDEDGCCRPADGPARDLDCVELCSGGECPRPTRRCDLTGTWIVEQHTTQAWTDEQHGGPLPIEILTWSYARIVQSGDAFTVETALRCGFGTTGTFDQRLGDETVRVLATRSLSRPLRHGTYREGADQRCDLVLERDYEILGADEAAYLHDVWRPGDPPLPLGAFPALPDSPPGLEDWDQDGHPGITVLSLLGDRYVSQRGWDEQVGTAVAGAIVIGTDQKIAVHWDGQEALSPLSDQHFRATWSPKGDGWVRYARTTLELADPLETCRRVRALARRKSTWAAP